MSSAQSDSPPESSSQRRPATGDRIAPKSVLQGNGLLMTQGHSTLQGFNAKEENPLVADYISEDFLQVLEVLCQQRLTLQGTQKTMRERRPLHGGLNSPEATEGAQKA